ncbi:MAG: hypothetical protein MJB14_06700 [Spirochaetes bacterium]|nr:hypothetical protein [Spirochaetota bacterium]
MKNILKKINIYSLLLFIMACPAFAIFEHNLYFDRGLNEKNGTFNLNKYLYPNYLTVLLTPGNENYLNFGAITHLEVTYPELGGFYFKGDFSMTRLSSPNADAVLGDIGSYWGSFAPFFGATHFGFKKRFFDAKFGYQNLVSSDAIYNHLMLDDYSRSILVLALNTMPSRFFDSQLVYAILRPHTGKWYAEEGELTEMDYMTDQDFYSPIYGKSLYFHKINIRPAPWLRFGIQESVLFLGENLNPWYANPFFIYFASQSLAAYYKEKNGSRLNTHMADIKMGFDWNIGFYGWRFYGEIIIDDSNAEWVTFKNPTHPDKVGFVVGGEIRGYLFTRYIQMPKIAQFIVKNLYINFEYSITSKYIFSRDPNVYYEYVLADYPYRYDENSEVDQSIVDEVNRVGNFIGYMFGPNSDCLDIAIGWRNDLQTVTNSPAQYQIDQYFDSFQDHKKPNRLLKMQLHYRKYRLGDNRNVLVPYGTNEHASYDDDMEYDSNGDGILDNDAGTDFRTSFMTGVAETNHIMDINVYSDLARISRFIFGLETKLTFHWRVIDPQTINSKLHHTFRMDIGFIINF